MIQVRISIQTRNGEINKSGSLVPQTPIREEKGSGNIVYNELCQTQECGATNQIASFVISTTSHDFVHIIYRANLHSASDVGNNY